MKTYTQATSHNRKKPVLWVTVAAVVAVGALLLALELTNTTHIFHKKLLPASSASQNTKGEPAANTASGYQSSSSSTSSTNASDPGDNKNSSGGSTAGNLITPTGNFVSAHKSVPMDAALSSVCNSTSGASCKIVFTQNGVTKALPAETTDRGGSAYWNSWTPSSIGLSPGSWTVQAVATLNGQSQTAVDALKLELVQ